MPHNGCKGPNFCRVEDILYKGNALKVKSKCTKCLTPLLRKEGHEESDLGKLALECVNRAIAAAEHERVDQTDDISVTAPAVTTT